MLSTKLDKQNEQISSEDTICIHSIDCTVERPKPLFWFRSDTQTETLIWPLLSADTITDTETTKFQMYIGSVGYFSHQNKVPEFKFQVK